MAVCQNLVPLVNIEIAGKWMFIPLKMVLIGIDPYPYLSVHPRLMVGFVAFQTFRPTDWQRFACRASRDSNGFQFHQYLVDSTVMALYHLYQL